MKHGGFVIAATAALVCAGCSRTPEAPAVPTEGAVEPAGEAPVDASWASEIEAARFSRNTRFGDPRRSPLAVVAVASLTAGPVLAGSGPDAELRLDGPGVASAHAEVVSEKSPDGATRYRVLPVEGTVFAAADSGEPASESASGSEGILLEPGARARIGRFLVYVDVLGTFGAVVRALDVTSPPFVQFDGLSYFDPDPAFRVRAEVTPYEQLRPIRVIDTQGWQRPAWAYGEATFSIDGESESVVLWLFGPDPGPHDTFFVAFTDGTSGIETYPACRYLSPPFVESGPVIFDFNRATNPSCAYNDGFACPLPPPGNRLSVSIRAGEKIYPHTASH